MPMGASEPQNIAVLRTRIDGPQVEFKARDLAGFPGSGVGDPSPPHDGPLGLDDPEVLAGNQRLFTASQGVPQ